MKKPQIWGYDSIFFGCNFAQNFNGKKIKMFNETQIAQRKNNNPTDKNLGLLPAFCMKNAQNVTAKLYLLKKVNVGGG